MKLKQKASFAKGVVVVRHALMLILVLLLCACGTQGPRVASGPKQPNTTTTPQVSLPIVQTSLPSATPVEQPSATPTSPPQPPIASYEVLNTYPHDPNAFTQGLIYEDGWLYEGTGLNGRSTLRKVVLETGEVVQSIDLDSQHFGEGITSFGDRIYQLTWQSQIGFIYDKATFEQVGTFSYLTEGWGLTHDGTHLIMSDGSATIFFLDPETLTTVRTITVTDPNGPVMRLNELEYVEGEIYANIWQTDVIVRISPTTGDVLGWISLSGLLSEQDRQEHQVDVLNGIAYDPVNKRLFVTGKLWPKLFEIRIVP